MGGESGMNGEFEGLPKAPAVAMYGRIILRGGKFSKTFAMEIPGGIAPKDLRAVFTEAGENMSIALRLFDKGQPEREVFMLGKNCATCNQNFKTASDVCPNHSGHTLPLLMPQPIEEATVSEKPKATPLTEDAKDVIEESIDRAREVGGPQMEAEIMGQVPAEPPAGDPLATE